MHLIYLIALAVLGIAAGCKSAEPKACKLVHPAKDRVDPYAFIDMGAPVPSFEIPFFEKKEDLERFQRMQLELLATVANAEPSPEGLPSLDALVVAGSLRLSAAGMRELASGTPCRRFAQRSDDWCKVEVTLGLYGEKRGWVQCMYIVLE